MDDSDPLGAGVLFSREGIVTGVTTAPVLWILAAIGAAIGLGQLLGGEPELLTLRLRAARGGRPASHVGRTT